MSPSFPIDRSLPRPGSRRQRVAFVLGGGAALGAYQAGVLLALAEWGIVPDMLVGASAGALNAAFLASHPGVEGATALASLWRTTHRRDVLPIRLVHLLAALIGRQPSMVSNRGVRRLIRQHVPFSRLEDSPTPLVVMATDLITGDSLTLSTGDVATALLASCAVPGILPPIEIGGRMFVDGGIADDLPVEVAIDEGATQVYVLPVPATHPERSPRHALGHVWRGLELVLDSVDRTRLSQLPTHADILVIPAQPTPRKSVDFRHADELVDLGHARAHEWLVRLELSAS